MRLGLTALAITDHDGFYGAVRFAEAAAEYPTLSTIYGAELSLGLTAPQNGVPDPEGTHLLVLARGVEGYHRLAGAITEAQLRGDEKGRPAYDLDELAQRADGHWQILTGCRKGHRAVHREGLDALVDLFGRDNVAVELIDHGHPGDDVANDALAALGRRARVAHRRHQQRPLRDAGRPTAGSVGRRRPGTAQLADLDGWLPASGQAFLRSGLEMQLRFARHPGAVAHSLVIARECAFDLRKASPRLPKQKVPPGHTPMTWLRELVRQGADRLYADNRDEAEERLQKELAVIEEKDFPGYFLIVHDIVAFAKSRGILCQGRGSAANSAVCYALGITAVDSILYDLPFERFLSATRDEEPDIDVDFDSDRREEVIQWVYETYGRRNAAQVANVISYRPRSAVRDMAKALGYSVGQQDAWSKSIDSWSSIDAETHIPAAGSRPGEPTSQGTAPSRHPLRRHGAHRAPGGRGGADRARPDGQPHRPAVGQGRLRLDGLGQVRPARPGHARRHPAHLRPGGRAHRCPVGAGDHPQGGAGRLRHALQGRLHRRLPGREPGADRHAAPAQAAKASTTWSPRSRSSGRARSRAALCIRTSGDGRATRTSTTSIRPSSRCSSGRWASRCSRSSSCRSP